MTTTSCSKNMLFFGSMLANESNTPSEEQIQLMDFAQNELEENLSTKKYDKYLLVNCIK